MYGLEPWKKASPVKYFCSLPSTPPPPPPVSLPFLRHPRLEGKPAWRECISNRNNVWCYEVESELYCYRASSRGCLHEHLRRNRVYSLTAGVASSLKPPCKKCQRRQSLYLTATLYLSGMQRGGPGRIFLHQLELWIFRGDITRLRINSHAHDILAAFQSAACRLDSVIFPDVSASQNEIMTAGAPLQWWWRKVSYNRIEDAENVGYRRHIRPVRQSLTKKVHNNCNILLIWCHGYRSCRFNATLV